jgi:hypothetical protein
MSCSPRSIPLSVLYKPTPPSPRTISNAYGLAIPPPTQRRSTYQRRDTPTQYLDPPEPSKEKKGTPYLEIPKSTIVINECPRLSPLNRESQSTIQSLLPRRDRSPSPEPTAKRKRKIDDRVLALAVTSLLAILIAIGIPLGVILPQKYIKPLPINVLVPFNLKPETGNWRRLEDAYIFPPSLSISKSHITLTFVC